MYIYIYIYESILCNCFESVSVAMYITHLFV